MTMMTPLEQLRERYPWPTERPDVPAEMVGWWGGDNEAAFRAVVNEKTKVIVELGSFAGRSALWIMEHLPPGITLICVDHWKGSREHQPAVRPHMARLLSVLYETFLTNLWDHRARVIPMRTTTELGMNELAALGIQPDVIYDDASHEEEDVLRDVQQAMRQFPKAELIGDDFRWTTVRKALAVAAHRCYLQVFGLNAWRIPAEPRPK